MADSRSKLQPTQFCLDIIVAIVVILTLCNSTHGQCTSCTRATDCSCKCSDGQVIDISSLGKKSGGPQFPYNQPDQSLPWEFAFNPCYKFSDDFCKDVVSCQRSTDKTSSYRLGTANSATWGSDGSTVTYQSVGDDGQTRTSVLTLVCDPIGTPDNPTFVVNGEDFSSPLQYDFTLTSICACPGGCKGGGGGGGLSAGSILCILFVVLVLVYIVGGMVFMKVVKKAEGKEMVPNVTFWMELPNYIKDGFLFLKSGCKGDYDTKI